MKKLLALIMIMALVFSTFASLAAFAEEDRVIKIAYCAPDQDNTQAIYTKCINAYIDELNAQDNGFKIEFSMFNADRDLQKQIEQVESLIVNGCDVMIFFACDADGAVSIIKQARDAGIIVVDATGNTNYVGVADCVFVGTGEGQYADLLDEWIQKNFDATGEKLKAGVIYGLMSQTPQLPRGDRRIAYAEAHPEQVEVVASGTGEWLTATAMSLTEDWLVAHPDMNCIFAANTDMAQGVVQALKSSKVNLDKFVVTTVDLTNVALDMLDKGELDVITGCDLYDQAVSQVDLCLNLLSGKFTEDIYYLEKMWCISADNAAEYREYSAAWNEKIANY